MTVPTLVITFPFSPIAFQLGFLTVRWYGVGYAVAFPLGLYMRYRNVGETLWGTAAFWSIVIGLVGARLYYNLQNGFLSYLSVDFRSFGAESWVGVGRSV